MMTMSPYETHRTSLTILKNRNSSTSTDKYNKHGYQSLDGGVRRLSRKIDPRKISRRRWRRILKQTCSHVLALSGVILCIVALYYVSIISQAIQPSDSGGFGICEPDGTFNAGLKTYSYWSPSEAFQITIGFGALPFSRVKFIDVAWDVVRCYREPDQES